MDSDQPKVNVFIISPLKISKELKKTVDKVNGKTPSFYFEAYSTHWEDSSFYEEIKKQFNSFLQNKPAEGITVIILDSLVDTEKGELIKRLLETLDECYVLPNVFFFNMDQVTPIKFYKHFKQWWGSSKRYSPCFLIANKSWTKMMTPFSFLSYMLPLFEKEGESHLSITKPILRAYYKLNSRIKNKSSLFYCFGGLPEQEEEIKRDFFTNLYHLISKDKSLSEFNLLKEPEKREELKTILSEESEEEFSLDIVNSFNDLTKVIDGSNLNDIETYQEETTNQDEDTTHQLMRLVPFVKFSFEENQPKPKILVQTIKEEENLNPSPKKELSLKRKTAEISVNPIEGEDSPDEKIIIRHSRTRKKKKVISPYREKDNDPEEEPSQNIPILEEVDSPHKTIGFKLKKFKEQEICYQICQKPDLISWSDLILFPYLKHCWFALEGQNSNILQGEKPIYTGDEEIDEAMNCFQKKLNEEIDQLRIFLKSGPLKEKNSKMQWPVQVLLKNAGIDYVEYDDTNKFSSSEAWSDRVLTNENKDFISKKILETAFKDVNEAKLKARLIDLAGLTKVSENLKRNYKKKSKISSSSDKKYHPSESEEKTMKNEKIQRENKSLLDINAEQALEKYKFKKFQYKKLSNKVISIDDLLIWKRKDNLGANNNNEAQNVQEKTEVMFALITTQDQYQFILPIIYIAGLFAKQVGKDFLLKKDNGPKITNELFTRVLELRFEAFKMSKKQYKEWSRVTFWVLEIVKNKINENTQHFSSFEVRNDLLKNDLCFYASPELLNGSPPLYDS